MKQYLVLHEDERFKRVVRGVRQGLVTYMQGVSAGPFYRGVLVCKIRDFMTKRLQSPLSGDDYDASFWISLASDIQYGCDGLVLRSGNQITMQFGPFDLISYAWVILWKQGLVYTRTQASGKHCVVYLLGQAPHERDSVPTDWFGLPFHVQREAMRLEGKLGMI